ncbi:cytosolic phospholipase A2 epsilon-like protein [Turdus rufiventris]|nr:cytosolic phospholipase A2 epsilon-like protein [Turdus rufiventris]
MQEALAPVEPSAKVPFAAAAFNVAAIPMASTSALPQHYSSRKSGPLENEERKWMMHCVAPSDDAKANCSKPVFKENLSVQAKYPKTTYPEQRHGDELAFNLEELTPELSHVYRHCVMISIFLVWPMSVRKNWPSLTHVEAIEHFNVLFHACQIFCAYVSTVSQSDCYVRLWLPTASDEIFHTKTIKNCRNPVWNETFYFRIQRQVKNVLEITVSDDDIIHDDDRAIVLLDVAKIPLGERVSTAFPLTSEGKEELEVEFVLENIQDPSETIITNGAIVHRKFDLLLKVKKRQEDLDVRLGFDLCVQEQDFIRKRKKVAAAALKDILQLEEDLQDDEVPVVAIMTTGGGTRALTAMYAHLLSVQEMNVLDCVSYITGLSGTTWTMSNLYEDPYWSQKDLKETLNDARKHVLKNKFVTCFAPDRLKYYLEELYQRKQEGHQLCFTDLWGLIIETMLHDKEDCHKLTDQQQALNQGQNPLPIYLSLNVKDKISDQDFREWVEFTPYEVGFPKYGAFIRAEDFGSEFFMGHLMKKVPESRICFLEDDEALFPTRPNELDTRVVCPPDSFSEIFRDVAMLRPAASEIHNFLKGFQINNNYLESEFSKWKDCELDSQPNHLTTATDYLILIDTAFAFATSYPPLMRPERKVDVILHFNYSSGSQTGPLKDASKYFAKQGIPFPTKVPDDQETPHLKECYIVGEEESPETPIVIFFPLVNDTFREYKAPGVKRSPSEMAEGEVDVDNACGPYYINNLSYSEENFDKLVNLSYYNVQNNKDLILRALRTAVERKKQCKKEQALQKAPDGNGMRVPDREGAQHLADCPAPGNMK